ncbi:MAG: dephospho-CoA kinase [Candidatus Rokubacteria bacterium]|nr:dephospho-CoA kinase [Candidatus Rokubacteria bacterium]
MFAHLGARVIDADVLAREVVAPGQPAHARIAAEFGPDVIQADGGLDRKRLGALVFADPERRKRLEAITHPAIRARQQRLLAALEEECFEGVVLWDAALLLESGAATGMDRVIVVYADEATQLERLTARDGLTGPDARARMASQMSVAEKAKRADHVIDNSGSRSATEAQVRRVWDALQADRLARLAARP